MSTTCGPSSKPPPPRWVISMAKATAVPSAGRPPVAMTRRPRKLLGAAPLVVWVFAPGVGLAQQDYEDPGSDPVPSAALSDAAPIEVVVVGEPPARTAGEVRLDRDLLEAAPSRSGSDLLERIPGVFISQHSGEGKAHQIFFRGFDAVH